MRVAAGAIARKYLREQLGVEIRGYLAQIGHLAFDRVDRAAVRRQSLLLLRTRRGCPNSKALIDDCAATAIRSARGSR